MLEELYLNGNALTRLPPALAAATNLRILSLAQNPNLSLTVADVDSILMCMLHLTHLVLGDTRTPQPVVNHLRASNPLISLSSPT